MLKPFLPQLQTTFIKALNDPNREVRVCAATALQKLIKLHTRVDPLFTELHNGVKNTEDNTIRLAEQESTTIDGNCICLVQRKLVSSTTIWSLTISFGQHVMPMLPLSY